jgi:hypothetical protein
MKDIKPFRISPQIKQSVVVQGSVPVGLRFYTSEGVFDASKESLKPFRVLNVLLPNQLNLKLVQDSLVSQEELDGLVVTDASDNPKLLEELLFSVSSHVLATLQNFTAPVNQTLAVFLSDSNWKAVRVVRDDEYNGQHNLVQPDGSLWRGGWIGKANSPLQAKALFHYERCLWQTHRGGIPNKEVYAPYDDLVKVIDIIEELQRTFTLENNTLTLTLNNQFKHVNLSIWPTNVLGQREFVSKHNLVPAFKDPITHFDRGNTNVIFSSRELIIIAISSFLRKYYYLDDKEPRS